MDTINDKKIKSLLASFNLLKHSYEAHSETLGEIVLKSVLIDIDVAVDMWHYLLIEYRTIIQSQNVTSIAGNIIEELFYTDYDRIELVLQKNQELKTILFSECMNIESQNSYISYLIEENKLDFADELLNLLYNNQNRSDRWYIVMYCSMPREQNITFEAYELLEKWCNKVTNVEERTKLIAKMVKYIN